MVGNDTKIGETRLPRNLDRSIRAVKTSLFVGALSLFAGLSMAGLSPVRADTIVTLEGVTFGDGGTASGYFELTVYGYVEFADITTTPGTSLNGAPMAGYTYLTSGALVNNAVPFDSGFYFNTADDALSLVLTAENPVTSGGFDPLILGSGVSSSLAGSYEACEENPSACGGVSDQDGRLVTSGTLYAPEPATLSLLGMGGLLLSVIRRKRAVAP
ncbi:MAG: PEP-CTERM sorting domain-containing protein [Rhodopila sp.]|jgi:hypothetical protein